MMCDYRLPNRAVQTLHKRHKLRHKHKLGCDYHGQRHLIPFYISQWPLLAIPTRRRIQISRKIRRKWLFTCSSFKCSFHRNGISVKVVLLLKMFSAILSLCVPNFRLVTRSAQFSRNLELCRRTSGHVIIFELSLGFLYR